MAVWDDIISQEDLKTMETWGKSKGFGQQPALIVIDMTYGFVDDRFPLAYGKTGWPCVKAIKPLLEQAREFGMPIFFSGGKQVHNPAERGLWKSAPEKLPSNLPDPNEIILELAPLPNETVIRKRRPSVFFGTELSSLLTFHRVDTVILTGMVTSGCVRASAVDAFSQNLKVIVPEDGVADRFQVSHVVNLFDIHMKYGDVMPVQEVMKLLNNHYS